MQASNGWQCGSRVIDISSPRLMGIVNATPDSFSDGGRFFAFDAALAQAKRLIDEGADILDIGGESTRPDAAEVDFEEELRRVLPLVEALVPTGIPISVDTSKPQVMRAALAAGASIINDVRALQAPGAVDAVADRDCGLVLMHMLGTPRTMQQDPRYENVVAEVSSFLRARRAALIEAGVAAARICVDPGFGFGKKAAHNLALLARLDSLAVDGAPLLVGLSRKSTLGQITHRAVDQRVHASVAAALIAVQRGAAVIRVHDVAATRDALAVWQAVRADDINERRRTVQ
jgi:dihydropteroate synthase